MALNDTKKFYWLKLDRNFFKRHDIKIIESMPNGKDYILFYLKLLCESIDHNGNLKFNENIPYNESMLATITDTNVDIVRGAVQIFTQLEMMEVLDDGTYFMRECQKMMGSETGKAQRMREYRNKVKQLEKNSQATNGLQCSQEIDIEKEKEIDNNCCALIVDSTNTYYAYVHAHEGEAQQQDEKNYLIFCYGDQVPYMFERKLFKEIYPELNVENEMKKIQAWITTNKKEMCYEDLAKLVSTWLIRAQEKLDNTKLSNSDMENNPINKSNGGFEEA